MGKNAREKKPVNNIELAGNNKLVTICHTVEAAIIAVAYFMEFVKGQRDILYVLMSCLIVLAAPILEWIFFLRKRDSKMVKHFVGFGFAVFYIFAMFTTENPFVFTYAIPILIAAAVYNDLKFSIKVNIGVIIVNILQAVKYMFFTEGWNIETQMSELEIQVLVMVLVSVYSVMVTKTMAKYNNKKIDQINEESGKVEELLKNVMEVSKGITTRIDDIHGKVIELDESMVTTKEAMEQVSTGTNDTATAVQKQLEMTGDIQKKVGDVKSGADAINTSIDNMMQALKEGNDKVKELLSETDESKKIGKEVAGKLSALNEIMQDMNMVVSMITDIASQTSLLALNASIEAARAGEAGKGFAVVATEISKMANDTESATIKITDMIDSVTEAIVEVVDVTGKMVSGIDGQSAMTNETANSFNVIERNAENIKDNSDDLTKIVENLDIANKEIVDSISTISAISEEVSAHADDTVVASENNSQTVANIATVVNELKELTNKLEEEA